MDASLLSSCICKHVCACTHKGQHHCVRAYIQAQVTVMHESLLQGGTAKEPIIHLLYNIGQGPDAESLIQVKVLNCALTMILQLGCQAIRSGHKRIL